MTKSRVTPTHDAPGAESATSGVRRRLPAEARRSSILAAARLAFTETGDMNGTTIKVIAEHGGISEGVIYRHFESKDQLFFEAVVEPLKRAVDELVAATHTIDDQAITPARQRDSMVALYKQLVATLEEVLPLLGLVLFGDPQVAQRFYRENFAPSVDRLAEAWRAVAQRHGHELESADVSARAVMGMALAMALDSHHAKKFDKERALALTSEGTLRGFFPAIE